MNGIEMLMKQMGIDPKKLFADFELLKKNIVDKLGSIDGKLSRIEAQGARIEAKLNALAGADEIIPVPEGGTIYKEITDGQPQPPGNGGSSHG